ncbi:MAG: TetR/AcrR family transcriptional regulator [Candidatus Marinimicrobia bacterium]|nr:TetR/AcrR family transcriptional regulator [Candidatus Neomarinimicrobiota bacterium]
MKNFTKRQTQIIQAAVVIIAENGIQGLTMKNIAAVIGISEPALYRHFSGKHEILSGIIKLMRMNTHENSHVSKIELSPIQTLELALRNRTAAFIDNPALAAIIFSEEIFISDNKLSREIRAMMDERQDLFIMLLSKGQEGGEVRTDVGPEQLAILIIGAFRFIVTKCHLFDRGVNLEGEVEQLIDSIKKMILV